MPDVVTASVPYVEALANAQGFVHGGVAASLSTWSAMLLAVGLKVGETYPMKIIKLAAEERKIGLSIRALKSDEFRADWESYQESAGDGSATLGDHFRNNR